jgi:hypothetical protein
MVFQIAAQAIENKRLPEKPRKEKRFGTPAAFQVIHQTSRTAARRSS